jgi:hypothetical protein
MVAFLERGTGEVPATELDGLILPHGKFGIMGRQVEMLLLRIINMAQVNSREASEGFDIRLGFDFQITSRYSLSPVGSCECSLPL